MDESRVTIALLAGGPATRLPGKLALDVEGEPMLARAHRRLTAKGWPCVIGLRKPVTDHAVPAGCTVAIDEMPGSGPLGALCTVARKIRTPLFFAAAGDLPNLSTAFVEKLLAAYDAVGDRKPAAVLPTWPDGKVEPLAALYDTKAFLRGAEAALAAGRRKVTAALDGADVLAYKVQADDEPTLLNINTPEDYAALERSNLFDRPLA